MSHCHRWICNTIDKHLPIKEKVVKCILTIPLLCCIFLVKSKYYLEKLLAVLTLVCTVNYFWYLFAFRGCCWCLAGRGTVAVSDWTPSARSVARVFYNGTSAGNQERNGEPAAENAAVRAQNDYWKAVRASADVQRHRHTRSTAHKHTHTHRRNWTELWQHYTQVYVLVFYSFWFFAFPLSTARDLHQKCSADLTAKKKNESRKERALPEGKNCTCRAEQRSAGFAA